MVASAEAQKAQVRDGFWVSGGLGYGAMGCENCADYESGVSGGLSAGGTLSPRWLIGAGTSGWTKSEDGARMTVGLLDARVRFYPRARGNFFLTGGVGIGSVKASISGLGSATETGVGAILGLGYDWRVSRNASITPYWNGFAMRNDNVDANVGQLGLAVTLH
jgi:hypothetical protein